MELNNLNEENPPEDKVEAIHSETKSISKESEEAWSLEEDDAPDRETDGEKLPKEQQDKLSTADASTTTDPPTFAKDKPYQSSPSIPIPRATSSKSIHSIGGGSKENSVFGTPSASTPFSSAGRGYFGSSAFGGSAVPPGASSSATSYHPPHDGSTFFNPPNPVNLADPIGGGEGGPHHRTIPGLGSAFSGGPPLNHDVSPAILPPVAGEVPLMAPPLATTANDTVAPAATRNPVMHPVNPNNNNNNNVPHPTGNNTVEAPPAAVEVPIAPLANTATPPNTNNGPASNTTATTTGAPNNNNNNNTSNHKSEVGQGTNPTNTTPGSGSAGGNTAVEAVSSNPKYVGYPQKEKNTASKPVKGAAPAPSPEAILYQFESSVPTTTMDRPLYRILSNL